MTRLVRKSQPIEYPADVARMRRVLQEHGYDASDGDLQDAWRDISDKFCSMWIDAGSKSDAELFTILMGFLVIEEKTK